MNVPSFDSTTPARLFSLAVDAVVDLFNYVAAGGEWVVDAAGLPDGLFALAVSFFVLALCLAVVGLRAPATRSLAAGRALAFAFLALVVTEALV